MCGIAGIIEKGHAASSDMMETMLDCIRYRGPDDGGIWQEGEICLGHRRLAILDLTSDGRQPMAYGDRYQLVFNGEIYNYSELRSMLCKKGYVFHSQTDSEVLLAAYDYWGEACQRRLNGMWAFAIYDRRKRVLFCSRDRFGIKPFYYFQNANRFAFGSEIKQLLPIMDHKPRANQPALEVFLAAGYLDYSEQTLFDEVLQLRGGHCLRYDLHKHSFSVSRWFDPMEIAPKAMSDQEAANSFRTLFENAIARHLRSDVPVGFCLSGGLDSSAIVCEANRQLRERQQPVQQYTVSSCFEDSRYDERPFIQTVVDSCPGVVSSKVFPRMDDLLSCLRDLVWHMDEPFSSTSIFAQHEVFRKAHSLGLKVMLDGQGADEQLAGYTDFYKLLFVWLFRHGHWARLRRELNAYFRLRSTNEMQSQWRFLAVTIQEALLPLWMQKRVFRCYQKNSPQRRWLHLSDKAMDTLCATKLRFAKRDPRTFICAFMDIGMTELLHYEDRNSMAFSVEARVPFLDADFMEGVFAMPFTVKMKDGKTKWVMRSGLEQLLPAAITTRYDKMGFVTPEDQWILAHKQELEPVLEQAAYTLAPIVDGKRFLQWYKGKQKIQRGDFRIWRLLCAAEWVRMFQVQLA